MQKGFFGSVRQLDRNKEPLRVEIVFSRFVNRPYQVMLGCFLIR